MCICEKHDIRKWMYYVKWKIKNPSNLPWVARFGWSAENCCWCTNNTYSFIIWSNWFCEYSHMPLKAKSPCSHPSCPNLTTDRYCDKHRKQRYTENNRIAHKTRDAGFYNRAQWKKVRRQQLIREPLCRECMKDNKITQATVVDHITPRSKGGADYDDDNLQSLCKRCHDRKTARENGFGT